MAVDAVLGMLGTGEWSTDERPQSWREGILYLFPNGTTPLTAIMSKLPSEDVNDPQFNWWTEGLGQDSHTTTIFTDALLSNNYATGGVVGTPLFCQVAAIEVVEYRVGHQVLLTDDGDKTVDINAKVIGTQVNGASSSIAVSLLEADTGNKIGSAAVTKILIIGSIHAEGAEIPAAVHYKPTKLFNFTQIFRTSLNLTRTQMKTRLRTGDKYQEVKRETARYHAIEMEKAYIFGQRTELTGSNNQKERTTRGILNWIRAEASANEVDYTTDSDFTGQTWKQGGEDFIDKQLEILTRFSGELGDDRLILAGSGALEGINKLAKVGGNINITPESTSYGMKVNRWTSAFGDFLVRTHPLFTKDARYRNSMLIISTRNIRNRIIDDTQFLEDPNRRRSSRTSNHQAIDGFKEEFLTEAGLELYHPETFMMMNGVGLDSP